MFDSVAEKRTCKRCDRSTTGRAKTWAPFSRESVCATYVPIQSVRPTRDFAESGPQPFRRVQRTRCSTRCNCFVTSYNTMVLVYILKQIISLCFNLGHFLNQLIGDVSAGWKVRPNFIAELVYTLSRDSTVVKVQCLCG